jgi:hypothetical protein
MATAPVLNLYQGITGTISSSDIEPSTRLKLAIVGPVKTGKSWLAATMPGEKYFFDFDNRKESLAGKPNVMVKTYQDTIQTMPKALAAMEQDVKMFEYNKTSGKPIPDVFVLDSMTWWVKACENDIMKSVSRLSRTISLSAKPVQIAAGWDVITAVRNMMEDAISRLAVMGHVICIFHEEPEKDTINSTAEVKAYTGKYAVHPFYLRTLLSTFNETWRIQIKNGEYFVTCKPTNEFGASTTLRIGDTEKANIADILAKHKLNLGKGVK